jgi:hypothetical protein
MARLTDTEKRQLLEATTRRTEPAPPRAPRISMKAYVAFATFASRFARTPKPVRFVGDNWKL